MTTKTSSVQHTEGPWRVNIWGCEFAQGVIETYAEPVREICHIAKFEVAKDGPTVEANARRIVACVNALEGISDPAAYIEHARTLSRDTPKLEAHDIMLAHDNAALRAERDALAQALRMVCDSGVALADPIETAMLAALAKVRT